MAAVAGVLAAGALTLAVSFGGTKEGAKRPWARALSAWVKVRPGQDPGGEAKASLSLARGECEGLQIYVPPPARKVDARVPPLRGPGAPLEVRVYREAFVPVRTPSNGEGATGLWPDPLIPVEDLYAGEQRRALPHDSSAERPLVLYLEVCAPQAQRPGRYRGQVTLTARGREAVRIPLSVQVHPFALPATSSLPTSFGISIYSLADGHGVKAETEEGRTLLRHYALAALRHRISLHGMSIDPLPTKVEGDRVVVDWTAYDREMGPLLEGTALPGGARFTTAEVRKDPRLKTAAQRRAYLEAYRRHFDEKKWPALLFFYAKDEPRPEDVPLVLRQSKDARSVQRLPTLVTAPLHEVLTPAADIVSPVLNCFFPRPGPASCPKVASPEALRKAAGPGKLIWWYQACPSHGCDSGPFEDQALERAYSGWASYMVDHPATLNRAMGPLGFLAGVDGELYFATVYAYNFRDPWTEGVWDFGGNGDGTLFYPGTPEHIGGETHVPVASLRLKHLRDGLEDYEYLTLLEKLGAGAFARREARKLAPSGYRIERDPAEWDEVRRSLTRRLDALWKSSEYARRSPVSPR